MPKSSRKARPHKGRQTGQQNNESGGADFKLADFADAAPSVASTGRMKKNVANAWKTEVKQMKGPSHVDKENLAWDEKNLSDFETYSDDGEDTDHNQDAEGAGSPCSKVKKKMKGLDEDEGNMYPIDIWFLIADNIAPECVATFSAICQTAHLVVHTVRFWSSMYKRNYSSDKDIPQALQPRYMEKAHGLRSRVVRSLFLLYPPFIHRLRSLGPFQHEPDKLEGAVCILMWHKRVKNVWHFFFKFKLSGLNKPCALSLPDRRDRLWHFTPDVTHNPEEHCCVMEIIMGNFVSLPVVMGHILRKAFVSVGQTMRYHKVKLLFTQQNVLSDRYMQDHGIAVIMDPAVNLRLLHWWDPAYPGNAQQLMSPTSPT